MEDDLPTPINHFRQQAAALVRRRVYVALIVSIAIFMGGLLFWPLNATLFRTYAEITLQLEPDRTDGAVLKSAAADRDSRLQSILRDCLSDEVLANAIGQATFQNAGGVAQLQIPDVRRHLSVGVTRDKTAESPIRWIQVVWTGQAGPGVQRFVNLLSQEIANRAARDIRLDSIQLKLEERFDQIARSQTSQTYQMVGLVEEAREQIEQQRSKLATLQQQIAGLGSLDAETTLVAQDQIDAVKQQVLNSDAHMLTLLRQQVMHHYEVDETDGLVQHIERLIQDRQAVLAQLPEASPAGAPDSRSMAASGGRSQVRTNPFVMASAPIRRSTPAAAPLGELQATINDLQVESLTEQMDQLQEVLTVAVNNRLPMINIASQVQRETSNYRVVQVQPAQVSMPLDSAPKQQWALGLSVIAVMIGTAFSLQNSPQSLARVLFRPSQLAHYLGIEHLGTIRTGKPQPNVIDNIAVLFGRRVFQAAEIIVVLSVAGVVMAMIWEPSLPGILMNHPLEGLCQAFWILVGR
jgi:hypothetical protein